VSIGTRLAVVQALYTYNGECFILPKFLDDGSVADGFISLAQMVAGFVLLQSDAPTPPTPNERNQDVTAAGAAGALDTDEDLVDCLDNWEMFASK